LLVAGHTDDALASYAVAASSFLPPFARASKIKSFQSAQTRVTCSHIFYTFSIWKYNKQKEQNLLLPRKLAL